MKCHLFVLINLLFSYSLSAQEPFITTWKTDNPGFSEDNQIRIVTSKITGYVYNYDVSWHEVGNEGNSGSLLDQVSDITIDFPSPGIYQVEITGDFPHINSSIHGDWEKLLSVEQWGSIAWQSMRYTFYRCENLTINATDAPNLSNVTDMSYMFKEAFTFNQNIAHWDVSNVKTMHQMFYEATSFNQNISDWDVGNVEDMSFMFRQAELFNQDISGWDVSKVTTMEQMFLSADSFNQNIGSWDITSVTNMNEMFSAGRDFNGDISGWDMSNVTNAKRMFFGLEDFNQDIGGWDVSNVSDLSDMFTFARSFNQDISDWDVSNVSDMSGMFNNTDAFNQDLSSWNVSKVEDMSGMFANTLAFDQDISGWDVSSVSDMNNMFFKAQAFNQEIGKWDTRSLTNAYNMLADATSFDQNLGNWNIQNVTLMSLMFDRSGLSAENYDLTLSGWASSESVPQNIELGASGLKYCNDEARQLLTQTYQWTILDDGPAGEAICNPLNIWTNTDKVYIYPNPSSDFLLFSNADQLHDAEIQVIDLKGKVFETKSSNGNSIDISSLDQGIYFLSVELDGDQKLIKFVKN